MHCIQSLTINVAEFMGSNKEEITLYFSTVLQSSFSCLQSVGSY